MAQEERGNPPPARISLAHCRRERLDWREGEMGRGMGGVVRVFSPVYLQQGILCMHARV